MGTNAEQFTRELKNEMNAAGPENFVAFRADLCADVISIAAGRSPIGATKRLVRSWGISFAPDRKGSWIYGSAAVRQALRRTKPGTRVWLGNDWFVAGFFEHGTGPRTTRKKRGSKSRGGIVARPMLRPAIESVKDRKR